VSGAAARGAPVRVRYVTDPGCPWAFAAEPARLRLQWRYGEQIEWELCMVALDEVADHRVVAERSGMPIVSGERLREAPSIHACRAVVAVRLRWPEREWAMLRRLQVLNFAGELLDDSDTLEMAAEQAGLPVAELATWADDPQVHAALAADMAAARADRVAGPPDEPCRLCPAYELVRAEPGRRLTPRPDPAAVGDVLAWAGMPLATAEVAAVCAREIPEVRAELARCARFEPVGGDGYWTR
jgi:predicted DsbA family dithiol-disulfide isomerase